MSHLADRCVLAARLFRLARDTEGHQVLAEVCGSIQRALAEGGDVPGATAPVLGEMLAAQERGDLLLVADVLELLLAPSLRG